MRPYLVGILLGIATLAGIGAGGWAWLGRRAAALQAAPIAAPLVEVAVPGDSAAVAEGERLAWLHGCHGCHADSLQGKVFLDEPRVMRLVAPNVTRVIRSYSDAELARLIRHGVTRTGRAVLTMPSAGFYHLSDADLGRLVAYLRTVPPHTATWPPTELRVLAKLAVVRGQVPTDAGTMDHEAPRVGASGDTSVVSLGRYRATTICTECHGLDLRGQDQAPGLMGALGYTLPQFTALLLDGRSRDGRDLGLMATTARRRFSRLRAAEIAGLWGYLRTLPLAPR